MKCGLCHEEIEHPPKSHIIPKALHLFGQEKGAHRSLLVMPADQEKRVERSHTGFYSRIGAPNARPALRMVMMPSLNFAGRTLTA
jgi:hypothetical protein